MTHTIFIGPSSTTRKSALFLIALIALLNSSVSLADDDAIYLKYADNYTESGLQPLKVPLLDKEQRVNKDAGTITLVDSDIDDNIRKSFEYAASVWENSILRACLKINVYFRLTNF